MIPQIVSKNCPIRPEHIDTRRHFFEAFDNMETESSANWIVMLCQEKGNWDPFTMAEIEAFYNKADQIDFWFNRLTTEKWIVEKDGQYFITVQFVARCYAAAPAVY